MHLSRPAAALVCLLAAAAPASGQPMGTFIRGLVDLTTAVEGRSGDEGPAILAALDTLTAGLAEWDAVIARMEAGLAADIVKAPPPAAAGMRATLGAAYLERGRRLDALRELDAAVKLDPQLGPAHMLRALILDVEGRQREAAAAYRLAWRHAPDPASAYHLLRTAQRRERSVTPDGDAARALALLTEAVDRAIAAPARPAAQLMTGHVLDDASAPSPVFAPAVYGDAVALVRRSRYTEAVAALRRAAAADPLVTDTALGSVEARAAVAARRAGSARAAVDAWAEAARRWPRSSEVHRLLGLAYREAGEHERAVEALDKAVQLDPGNERARLAKADLLLESGGLSAARATLEQAVAALPRSGRAQWMLGRVCQLLGDELAALRSFEAAAARPAIFGAGHVHAAIGRLRHNHFELDAAAAAYRRRIDLAPNDAVAHYELGELYRAEAKVEDALPELLIAALLNPGHARALTAIGQLYASAGRDADAVRLLERAVALDPDQAEARYALSRALARTGRAEDARRELEAFQRLQSRAMEEQRRQFQENLRKIEEALEAGPRREEPSR